MLLNYPQPSTQGQLVRKGILQHQSQIMFLHVSAAASDVFQSHKYLLKKRTQLSMILSQLTKWEIKKLLA